MKVIVTKYLNVRVGRPSVNAPSYQYLAPGSELEVDGNLYDGDTYDGNNKWFKDEAGNYYWSGGVKLTDLSEKPLSSNSNPSSQWVKNLNIKEIWSDYKEYGDAAKIAILDTGIDLNNSDFAEPVLTKVFVKSLTGSTSVQDNHGHGTFCTSLIACKNQKLNIGIAPRCKTLIGKISHGGELLDFNLILEGIDWAIKSGADIISISMGIPIDKEIEVTEFQSKYDKIVKNKNVLVFAASGDSHSGQIISKEYYPASFNNCNSIGTVKNGQIDNITIRSDKTKIHTVGIDIQGYALNSVIDKQSGTSMSVAIISGLMALAVSKMKKTNGEWVKNDILSKLIESGNPITPEKILVNPKQFFNSL